MAQLEAGIRGGAGEIGIHHGKLFLLLYLALRNDERAFALDVFEDQQFNVDASGRGDREVFLENFRSVGGVDSRLTIFAKDSCSVTAADLRKATGPLRLMSIDGGHTEGITYNDMRLADELLADDGLLILDDVYQERWPAVAVGAFRFMLETDTRLRPFAISPNKMYFCKNPTTAEAYQAVILEAFPQLRVGDAELFGRSVSILGRQTLVNRVRNMNAVRNNPALYDRLSRVLHTFR
jgi:hypothetical protein